MGLLTEGSPLSWEETKGLANHVRKHGITQFIHLYRRLKDRKDDVLKWGDEVIDIVLIDESYRQSIYSNEIFHVNFLIYFLGRIHSCQIRR